MFIAWSVDLVCLKQCLTGSKNIYPFASNRLEGLWDVGRTDIGQNNITLMPITQILKERDNLPEEQLSSVPSKKSRCTGGHVATHLASTKERFLCANETKMEFFTLKDEHFNWNRAGAAHCSAMAGQRRAEQWAVRDKNPSRSLKETQQSRRKQIISAAPPSIPQSG